MSGPTFPSFDSNTPNQPQENNNSSYDNNQFFELYTKLLVS